MPRGKSPRSRGGARLVCAAENAEALRNGIDRPVGDADNGARLALGQAVEYRFAEESVVSRVRLVFDSDLNDETMPEYERNLKRNMICNRPRNLPDTYVPKTMTRAYRVEGITAEGIVPLVEETGKIISACARTRCKRSS